MTEPLTFALQPFQPTPTTETVSIVGSAARRNNALKVVYRLKGNCAAVAIPNISQIASSDIGASHLRQNYLWERTCFEFFLCQGTSPHKSQPYWEFNLSPNGAWNVFSLEAYRQNTLESSAFRSLPFAVELSPQALQLEINIDLTALVSADAPIQVGISAVLLFESQGQAAEESFWAIAHPGPEADFHHPDSFVLSL